MTEMTTTISNVCSLGKLNKKISLHEISGIFEKSKLNPSKFHSLILKKFHKNATLLVYESGRIVSLGAKSIQDSKESVEAFVRHLNANKYPHELIDFTITNIVGTSKVGSKVRLDTLYESNRGNSWWEPELFPALKYKFKFLGVTVKLFASGKMYAIGAKSADKMEEALRRMKRIALRHRCTESI